jgi:hypothetical protein
VLRRNFLASGRARAAFAIGAAFAVLVDGGTAHAASAWISGADLTPVEQRVAIALGPDRTTEWTSLRFVAPPGPVAFVVPVAPGAAVDRSSDAWLESLEVATAPRVFPPVHASPTCPGEDAGAPAHPFDLGDALDHEPSLPAAEVVVLDGAGALASWASSRGLVLAGDLAADLGATGASRFVGVRVDAPGGLALGPTLRVVVPGAAAALPLGLVRAGAGELRVTAWIVGAGRASLTGADAITIDDGAITWRAAKGRSNYEEARSAALAAAGPAGALAEAASHEALAASTPIDDGRASIDGVVVTYFERAVAYGDTSGDATACVAAAASALASALPVAATCAPGQLAATDGEPCEEKVAEGELDPAALRCGEAADDLAIALGGATPSTSWLTRQTFVVPASGRGVDRAVELAQGEALTPVRFASKLDASGCPPAGSAPPGGQPGTGSATPAGHDPPGGSSPVVPSTGGAQGANGEASHDGALSGAVAHVSGGCDCSGTSSSAEGSDQGSTDDGCGGDTSSSDEQDDSGCSSSTSGDSSGSDSCDSSSSSGSSGGDSCGSSGSSGGESCSGGDSSGGGDCSIHAGRGAGARKRPLRLSPTAMALLAMLATLRRARRPSRRGDARRPSAVR